MEILIREWIFIFTDATPTLRFATFKWMELTNEGIHNDRDCRMDLDLRT